MHNRDETYDISHMAGAWRTSSELHQRKCNPSNKILPTDNYLLGSFKLIHFDTYIDRLMNCYCHTTVLIKSVLFGSKSCIWIKFVKILTQNLKASLMSSARLMTLDAKIFAGL